MLEFIDKIVIPFLASLYGWLGYGGVMVAMAIESAMIPLPSELILPFAGFLVSDPTAIEPLTHGAWDFWLVVVAATIGNTIGSVIGYFIGAWGGRPFLERWGKYLLIRPHEIELADHFFQKYGSATAFFSWQFNGPDVWYYDLFQIGDGGRQWIGRTYDENYVVPGLTRQSNGSMLIFEIVAVAPDGSRSAPAQAIAHWR